MGYLTQESGLSGVKKVGYLTQKSGLSGARKWVIRRKKVDSLVQGSGLSGVVSIKCLSSVNEVDNKLTFNS